MLNHDEALKEMLKHVLSCSERKERSYFTHCLDPEHAREVLRGKGYILTLTPLKEIDPDEVKLA